MEKNKFSYKSDHFSMVQFLIKSKYGLNAKDWNNLLLKKNFAA